MEDSAGSASFVRELRRALQCLYDPDSLRQSPLNSFFGLDPQRNPTGLREHLLQAVEGLKPSADVPPRSRAWRFYGALYHRYVDQFAQHEVARTLGLSVRQLRREERVAMRMLADHLRAHRNPELWESATRMDSEPNDESLSRQPEPPTREQELRWLERSLPSEPVAVAEIIEAVLKTVNPLLAALHVSIEPFLAERLPRLAVQHATAKQALLNVLTAAARAVPGGQVCLSTQVRGRQVSIGVQAIPRNQVADSSPHDYSESLAMAQRLAALSGGALQLIRDEVGPSLFAARLLLPAAEEAAILVVDDNADTLQLFQRYLADTPYTFVGTRDSQQTLALAEELHPQVIVLDVMLPDVDGWELLGRLREDPTTQNIPVIVCTILPEEQLALALGAAEFMRKPVHRPDFLATVERQIECRQRSFG